MKVKSIFSGVMLSASLLTSAQGAPIGQGIEAAPDAAASEQGVGATLFPAPKLANPWESLLVPVQSPTTPAADDPAEASLAPQSHTLYESHASATNGFHPSTDLVQVVHAASRISEPASEVLMLIGLSALAIVIRRKMPESF